LDFRHLLGAPMRFVFAHARIRPHQLQDDSIDSPGGAIILVVIVVNAFGLCGVNTSSVSSAWRRLHDPS
jgi:hypothetical protein